MFKKALFIVIPFASIILASCEPAAEDRNEMHRRAQIISDSMANLIKVALQEAEMPGYVPPQPVPPPNTSTAAPTNTNAANTAQGNTVK